MNESSLMMKLINNSSDRLPQINFDFILNYRKRQFDSIKNRIEGIFKEAIVLLEPYEFSYVGYREIGPEEILNNKDLGYFQFKKDKMFEIHINSIQCVRYDFKFKDTIIPTYLFIPFLKDHRVSYGGVHYYPDLPIIEKCIHVNTANNLILIKVTRMPLMFWRELKKSYVDVNGYIYHSTLITAKVHNGITKKDGQKIPLPIYHLTEGFEIAKLKYGFKPEDLDFVSEANVTDVLHIYFKIKENVFIKIHRKSFFNMSRRRFVMSIITLLTDFDIPFNIDILKDPNAIIWLLILGKYTYTNPDMKDKDNVVIDFAREHIITNQSMLDGITIKSMAKLGIEFNNFQDFLLNIFFNFDRWFSSYDPADLYDKRISFTSIYAIIERAFCTKVFDVLRRIKMNKGIMDNKMAKKFWQNAASDPGWFKTNAIFQANPAVYNNNAGLGVLSHRFLSIDSDESGGTRKSKHTPMDVRLAHPSRGLIVAATTVPSSSPLISGSINAFLHVDEEGNFIVSDELKKYVENVYQ